MVDEDVEPCRANVLELAGWVSGQGCAGETPARRSLLGSAFDGGYSNEHLVWMAPPSARAARPRPPAGLPCVYVVEPGADGTKTAWCAFHGAPARRGEPEVRRLAARARQVLLLQRPLLAGAAGSAAGAVACLALGLLRRWRARRAGSKPPVSAGELRGVASTPSRRAG